MPRAANVTDAQAALQSDTTSLGKASIKAPIDGVILTRTVDPGNAVAASLQAVTLFTLAEDLSKMKLQVNVDEADVGMVTVGQKASFTVAAYPSRRFPPRSRASPIGSTTTDNVVTYITYLEVDNPDGVLRPGHDGHRDDQRHRAHRRPARAQHGAAIHARAGACAGRRRCQGARTPAASWAA